MVKLEKKIINESTTRKLIINNSSKDLPFDLYDELIMECDLQIIPKSDDFPMPWDADIWVQADRIVLSGHAASGGFGECTTIIPKNYVDRFLTFIVHNISEDLISKLAEYGWIVNTQEGIITEGNSVSDQLPSSLDSFLQDFAQSYGGISYIDIIDLGRVWRTQISKEIANGVTNSVIKLKRELKDYDGDLYELAQENNKVKEICDMLIRKIKNINKTFGKAKDSDTLENQIFMDLD